MQGRVCWPNRSHEGLVGIASWNLDFLCRCIGQEVGDADSRSREHEWPEQHNWWMWSVSSNTLHSTHRGLQTRIEDIMVELRKAMRCRKTKKNNGTTKKGITESQEANNNMRMRREWTRKSRSRTRWKRRHSNGSSHWCSLSHAHHPTDWSQEVQMDGGLCFCAREFGDIVAESRRAWRRRAFNTGTEQTCRYLVSNVAISKKHAILIVEISVASSCEVDRQGASNSKVLAIENNRDRKWWDKFPKASTCHKCMQYPGVRRHYVNLCVFKTDESDVPWESHGDDVLFVWHVIVWTCRFRFDVAIAHRISFNDDHETVGQFLKRTCSLHGKRCYFDLTHR